LNSNQVTEDGTPFISERNGGDLSAQENEIRPPSPIHEESQPKNGVHPCSPISIHMVSPHVQNPHSQGIVEVILPILGVPFLLTKGVGIPYPGRQIMKSQDLKE